ncbi:PTS fructose transporter subunit IIBC [Neisseria dentiae]|uniref:protein-N(pi)-phosphohistidine--D-fructose phosphotransferase n=1 Tax=Neisseria dentiae TaxID=194197 RepID=A0A1X3D396_9NEIS|nr:fructose-specific PTS transporter subunit EIIC [Neisseria dentiae]OSI14181.1 PTS fructose transporter subunit IIBC [Neisseria dentiae]QMT45895.1 PTS transporter subunit EIIC [Neisseria dentiae]STZ51901.1 EIIBC-Fru [Neisseria dentiae]
MSTSVLFIPNHPAKAANALILARKLASLAQEKGLRAEVAALSDAAAGDFSRIVFVGQLPEQIGAFPADRIAVAGLQEVSENAAAALQRVLDESGSAAQSSAAAPAAAPAAGATAVSAAGKPLHFVAITACPTGVAHTFMAADALKQGAAKLGYTIDVETQGSVGAKSILSEESIARADYVILATDIEVDTSRFAGKKVYRCPTGFALKQTDKAFAEAVANARIQGGAAASGQTAAAPAKEKSGFYKHLLTGVSFMLPLVVAGGLLIAMSFIFGINAFEEKGSLAAVLMETGKAAFGLMVPILAGYIAYSIADRPGLAPGLIGGALAVQLQSGFLGGIVAGFLAGYLALLLVKHIKLPVTMEALKPILIVPLISSLAVGLIMFYIVGEPVAQLFAAMNNFLTSMGTANAVLLGVIIGAMMCVDLGGPINKAAYTFSVGLLTTQNYFPMATAMAGGMVPAIGIAIATMLAKRKFTESEVSAGKASFVLGLCFISEGAIPFAARDPMRVIPCCIAGGALTGALVALFQNELHAPHGGIFVLLIPNAINKPVMYLLAIAAGSLLTGVLYAVLKRKDQAAAAAPAAGTAAG